MGTPLFNFWFESLIKSWFNLAAATAAAAPSAALFVGICVDVVLIPM